MQECLGVDNAGVCDHRHGLVLAQAGDEVDKLLVLHLCADLRVAEQAAVDAEGGIHRVHAGAYLHHRRLLNDVAAGNDNAALLQRRVAVRERILDEQVVRIFRVDVNRADRALGGDERLRALDAVLGERLSDALVRMRGDLVDHGQRIGVLLDEGKILVLGDKAAVHPALGHVAHGAF